MCSTLHNFLEIMKKSKYLCFTSEILGEISGMNFSVMEEMTREVVLPNKDQGVQSSQATVVGWRVNVQTTNEVDLCIWRNMGSNMYQ